MPMLLRALLILTMTPDSRAEQHSLLLTVCLLFFSVISSVFIVAGSMALVVAGACWVR